MTQRDACIHDARLGHSACGKQCYSSRKAAKRALRTSPHIRDRKSMREYRCDRCGHWHVGHLPAAAQFGVASAEEVYRR